MPAVRSQPRFSYPDYLAWEQAQTERHEYLAGEVFAMAGASTVHNTLSLNIAMALRAQTRGTPCRVYMADVKLRVEAANACFYPDVFVTCQATDAARSFVLQDDLLVVEVLSPSTEGYDRGDKFSAYRLLPSLQAVIFVSQNQPHIEVFMRDASGVWTLHEASGLDARLPCATAERSFELSLAEVYADVAEADFAAAAAEAAARRAGTSA